MKARATLVLAFAAVAAVLVPYVALGGASYEPTPVADPCERREWRSPDDLGSALEQVVLSALDGAACRLDVTREELVLALRSEEALDQFADERNLSRAEAEEALGDGLERAVEDAEEAGVLTGLTASIVRRVAESVPPYLLLDLLERVGRLVT